MRPDRKLLLANKAWAKERLDLRPDYFKRMENSQRPQFLWIGCSDSRVPAEEVTDAEPGELFVHRNVANLVVHTDFNLISVVQYAVEVLEVPHVIICGHYRCGGIRAALSHGDHGLINKWLRHIKDVFRLHRQELEPMTDINQQWDRMVELNVIEQVNNLAATAIIQNSWSKFGRPYIHGWVYDLRNGRLADLVTIEPGMIVDPIYRYEYGTGVDADEERTAGELNSFPVSSERRAKLGRKLLGSSS